MSHKIFKTALIAAIVVVAACSENGPTSPLLRKNSGTVALPAGTAAVLLSFGPASDVDSVRIGTPSGGYVSSSSTGRVLALGNPGLGPTIRFQVYGRGVSSGTVVQVSNANGTLLPPASAAILFDR